MLLLIFDKPLGISRDEISWLSL